MDRISDPVQFLFGDDVVGLFLLRAPFEDRAERFDMGRVEVDPDDILGAFLPNGPARMHAVVFLFFLIQSRFPFGSKVGQKKDDTWFVDSLLKMRLRYSEAPLHIRHYT